MQAEVTHEGEVYRLVNSSQSEPVKNNSFYTGDLYNFYKLVYGSEEDTDGENDSSTPSTPQQEEEEGEEEEEEGEEEKV